MGNIQVSNYYFHEKGNDIPLGQTIDLMKIRRMHATDKVSLKLAVDIIKKNNCDFIIYSSRHGQIANSTEIIKAITLANEVSPAIFSLSVHNAPVGMLTILENLQIPHTSISAAEDSFLTGLRLSAIKADKYVKILYIYTEYALPELYSSVKTDDPELSFIALISKNDSHYHLNEEFIDSIKNTYTKINDQISAVIDRINHVIF